MLLLDELTTFLDEYDQVIYPFSDVIRHLNTIVLHFQNVLEFVLIGAGALQNLLFVQIGVVNAVKNCVAGPGDVAALWVTHRLEELKYADGAIYMEEGRIMIHGDVSSVARFLKDKQSEYIKHFNF